MPWGAARTRLKRRAWRSETMATTSVSTAKRGCCPKTPSDSASPATYYATRFASPRKPSTEAAAHEPVFAIVRQRIGNVGAACPYGAAGREPGQFRNHAHARGRTVSAQRRGVRDPARRVAVLFGI